MNKKILLISYHFPPSPAVGGLRAANIARFLPGGDSQSESTKKWQPLVLTIKDKYITNKDYEQLADLEDVIIYKAGKIPKLMGIYSFIKRYIKKIIRTKASDTQANLALKKDNAAGESNETVTKRAKRYYSSLFLALPDFEKNWIIPATIKAISIIRKNKIDCILTSCPPYSVHIIGLLTHMITGVKWIVDYRDPWYIASKKRMYPTCTLSRKIESFLESAVIKRATLVLCNTKKLRDTLECAYSHKDKDSFVFIPNGISTDIFDNLGNLPKYETFTLTYTGSLYFFRTPEPVFRALKELIDEGKLNEDDVRIKLVGHCQTIDGYPTSQLVSSYKLENIVEVLPPVSYLQSLEIVKKSHLALLFAPDQPYQIPAKVYDYMGTGTEILALAGDGATSEMVKTTKTGSVFTSDDHQGLKTYLFQSIAHPQKRDRIITEEVMKKFDRKKVVGDLAHYLDSHCT